MCKLNHTSLLYLFPLCLLQPCKTGPHGGTEDQILAIHLKGQLSCVKFIWPRIEEEEGKRKNSLRSFLLCQLLGLPALRTGCSYTDRTSPHKRTNASLIVKSLLRGQALTAERRRPEMNKDKGKEGEVEVVCVCVCLSTGYPWVTVNLEIPISSYSEDDVPSIPWDSVVILLSTEKFPTSP
jgi:hypothetical protein